MPLFSRRRDVDKLVAEAVEKALQPYVANAANHQAGVTQGIPSGQFAVQTVGNQAQVALPRDGSGFDSGFGPGYPLIPDPLDPLGTNGRTPPRRSQYQVAWNLQIQDRQVPWTILKGLAEECDIVNRCIELKQDEMCGYDWSWGFSPQIIQQIMAETGETNSARATAIAREKYGADLDRVNAFFEMPDKDMNQTFSDWLQALLWDHFVYDGVAIYPSYNLDGTLRALELVDASTIKLLRDNRGRIPQPPAPAYQQILYGFPRGEFQHGEDADDEFRNDQLSYYIKRPRNTSVYGFPVVEETMALSTTYLARQAWMRAEYQNGVMPKMMWEIPPSFNWTPEQMAYHEQAFNDRLQGQTQRRQMAFFAPGKPTFAPNLDEHYKQDYDGFLISGIGALFGIQSSQLGIANKSALRGSNVEEETEQGQMYTSRALINWVVDIINDLARKYLGIGPEITLTNNGNDTAEDSLSIVQADAADVAAGISTRNEVRAKRGLPLIDLPEADQLAITTGTGVEFLTGTLQAQESGQTIAANMAATGATPGQPAGEPVGHPAGAPAGSGKPAEPQPGQPAADEQDQAAVAADAKPTPKEQAAKKSERAAYDRFMAKGDPNRRPFMWHYHTPDEVAAIEATERPGSIGSWNAPSKDVVGPSSLAGGAQRTIKGGSVMGPSGTLEYRGNPTTSTKSGRNASAGSGEDLSTPTVTGATANAWHTDSSTSNTGAQSRQVKSSTTSAGTPSASTLGISTSSTRVSTSSADSSASQSESSAARVSTTSPSPSPGTSAPTAAAPALSASGQTTDEATLSAKGVAAAHEGDVQRLMTYWAEGEGAAKINWGHDGDFDRCRVELGKYVGPDKLDGLCANLHHRATGAWPGHAPGESKKSADPKAIAWADHPGHKFADAIVAHFAPQIAAALTDGTEGLHAAISTARGVLGKSDGGAPTRKDGDGGSAGLYGAESKSADRSYDTPDTTKAIAPEPPVVAAPPVATQPNLALVETMQAAQAAVAQAVQIDTTQLAATLTQLYANAGLTGSHAAATVTGGPVLTELASLEATVNWDTWEPGDKVAADVVRHAGLQQLLTDQDATIKGIVDSALDRLSTSLANSIAAGDNMATTAKAMRDVIADPKRAYVIANTETARAMSASSIATYAANGVAEWDWLAEPDACPVCLKNEADSPYDVGEGPTIPQHPSCRCAPTPHVEVPE